MTLDKIPNRLHTILIIYDLQRLISSGTMPMYPRFRLVRGCGEYPSGHARHVPFDFGNNLHPAGV